jgi:deoxyribonuclease V
MNLHEWNVSPRDARAIQEKLRERVSLRPLSKPPELIAGVDVSMNRFDTNLYAGFVVVTYPGLEVVETSCVQDILTFPYIPGLLSFREIPGLLKVYEKLDHKPDLIMVDGHGIAHPRRLGIASHLGVTLDIPIIGCAKSKLIGTYEEPEEVGMWSALFDKSDQIGAVLKTKKHSKPLFVSPGHKITITESVGFVLETLRGYRLPEPTRRAHIAVNEFRKMHM